MATSLQKRIPTGRRLAKAEVDANWTKIQNELNKDYSDIHTLVTGDNIINHAKDRLATNVTFFTAAGVPILHDWKRYAADPTNKIVVTVPTGAASDDITGIEINITTKAT